MAIIRQTSFTYPASINSSSSITQSAILGKGTSPSVNYPAQYGSFIANLELVSSKLNNPELINWFQSNFSTVYTHYKLNKSAFSNYLPTIAATSIILEPRPAVSNVSTVRSTQFVFPGSKNSYSSEYRKFYDSVNIIQTTLRNQLTVIVKTQPFILGKTSPVNSFDALWVRYSKYNIK